MANSILELVDRPVLSETNLELVHSGQIWSTSQIISHHSGSFLAKNNLELVGLELWFELDGSELIIVTLTTYSTGSHSNKEVHSQALSEKYNTHLFQNNVQLTSTTKKIML